MVNSVKMTIIYMMKIVPDSNWHRNFTISPNSG